ncbi:S41 family peptidase [Legionella dresdenensis]|uniref:S41 family peptidase n=1 Tax=Legionella dresdenensis TaxID=450200 RepID=A0ABV8CHF9_9GAMM
MSNRLFYQGIQIALVAGACYLPMKIIAGNNPNDEIPMEDVQRFSNALYQIKKNYVSSTKDAELFDNAIKGMVSSLDPHSTYLNEKELTELTTATSGNFAGLGIEITMENGVVKVITPLNDSPAYKAGIKAGDYIIKLGAQSVQGMTLDDAVSLMRGKPGSTIQLVVLRKGQDKPLNFNVVRETIQIKSVDSKLIDKHYGYVRLSQFQELTGKDMVKAIEALKQQSGGKLTGLVLDLRNNPGGLLDSAIEVADAFLDSKKSGAKEIIVYTKGRLPDSKYTATATPGDIMNHAPIVVLINSGSASASEIVAGALKDNKRAVTMGTRSFGKGSVQTVLPLDDKRAIKLTTALYYTPSGTSIQAKGITPDIVIEELKVSGQPKADKLGAEFSEASLSGHLANGNKADQNKGGEESSQADMQKIMQEDYQLYSALTVLKGLGMNQ